MIALRMLMPLLTPNAIEDALGAVIERANSTGALCHEETIGVFTWSFLICRDKLTVTQATMRPLYVEVLRSSALHLLTLY